MMATLGSLLVVYAVVGGLELLDRTSFTVMGLAARRPGLATWAGAATAFLATSAIAVTVGTVLIAVVGRDLRYVELAGGIVILAYAAHLATEKEVAPTEGQGRSAFVTALVTIFLLELGDTTMILILLFAGSLDDPVGVFVAGALALLSVAALAATLGAQLGARLSPAQLKRVVVTLLVIVGVATVIVALLPQIVPAGIA